MPTVAVIGAGYWGSKLATKFKNRGALKFVVDTDQEALARWPGASLETALISNVDGIVIATPAETHYNLARLALEADKHVFIEKPMTTDPMCAQYLVDLAKKRNKRILVGHLMLYHPGYEKMKANLSKIAPIRFFNASRFGGRLRDEGVLYSLASHDIAMAIDLFGKPSGYTGNGASYIKSALDIASINLSWSGKLRGSAVASWVHSTTYREFIVAGDKGCFIFDGNKLTIGKSDGESECYNYTGFDVLDAECGAFLDDIQNGTEPRSNGELGLEVVAAISAAMGIISFWSSV